jgi:hypothetical protein
MADEERLVEETLEEEEPPSRTGLVMWLIALGVAALFLPVYLVSQSVSEATIPLQAQAESLLATLTAPPQIPQEEETLTARLLSLRGQLNALREAPATIAAGHTDWPAIMRALLNYDARSIRLTGFSHEAAPLVLTGSAVAESAIIEYANTLQASGLFSRVSVQSIILNPPPTPTPAPTSVEGTSAAALQELTMPFVFTLSLEFARPVNGPG